MFPILSGQVLEYRGEDMGIFVINVDDAHFEMTKKFLGDRKIDWKEIEGLGAK